MATRGPKPKPTKLRILHGDEERRINRNEPDVAPGRPEKLPGLTPVADALFDYVCDLLEPTGVLTKVDGLMLAILCEEYATWREAATMLNARDGVVTHNDLGELKRHPAAPVMSQAANIIRTLCAEFGMSPSSRSRLLAPPGSARDDIAGLLSG
jgi:P27 family predicted phage terminase small subunit